MHIDELLKTLKAGAYEKGVPAMAEAAGMSDDTLRRILSDDPPKFIRNLRKLEELATTKARGALETAGDESHGKI